MASPVSVAGACDRLRAASAADDDVWSAGDAAAGWQPQPPPCVDGERCLQLIASGSAAPRANMSVALLLPPRAPRASSRAARDTPRQLQPRPTACAGVGRRVRPPASARRFLVDGRLPSRGRRGPNVGGWFAPRTVGRTAPTTRGCVGVGGAGGNAESGGSAIANLGVFHPHRSLMSPRAPRGRRDCGGGGGGGEPPPPCGGGWTPASSGCRFCR